MKKQDYDSRYTVNEKYKPLPPLSRTISTVAMNTKSNDISSGMDLILSSYFGSDTVTLNIENEGSIIVHLDIFRANIILEPVNANIKFQQDEAPSEAFKYTDQIRDTSTRSAGKSVNFEPGARGAAAIGQPSGQAVGHGSLSGMSSNENVGEREFIAGREAGQLKPLGHDALLIEKNPDGAPLSGALVSNYRGWRVTPRVSGEAYGVIARARVRESWIDLRFVESTSQQSKIGRMLRVFRSNENDERLRKKAFEYLLRHLVNLKLQDKEDIEEATLSADYLIANLEDEEPVNIYPLSRNAPLTLPSEDLISLLSVPRDRLSEVLYRSGVDGSAISDINQNLNSRKNMGLIRLTYHELATT